MVDTMGRVRDVVVAVAAVAVLFAAGMGLAEIDSRAGPYDLALQPVAFTAAVEGTFRTVPGTGFTTPTGTCIPQAPATACTGPATEVDLRVQDLPRLGGATRYLGFIVGAGVTPFGALEAQGDGHVLRATRDVHVPGPARLVVALHVDADAPTPGPLVVLDLALPTTPADGERTVAAQPLVRVGAGEGAVRLNEIGGFTVSATAVASLASSTFPGWEHRAWLQGTRGTIDLGAFTADGEPGNLTLGARVERVRLEDQSAFLVTLRPTDAGDDVFGFPAYAAPLPLG